MSLSPMKCGLVGEYEMERQGVDVRYIEITEDWLNLLKRAIIPVNGTWIRLGWIEPLVDIPHAYRANFVLAECEMIGYGVDGSQMFSKN